MEKVFYDDSKAIKDKQLKKMTEIGILKSLPNLMKVKPKPGRLTNRLYQLIRFADLELKATFPKDFFPNNKDTITDLIDRFGKIMDWKGKETHVVTVISFGSAVIENSESKYKYEKELQKTITDIVDYFERQECFPEPVLWEASNAFEKWKRIKVS